jgi:hypothetical protein
MGGGKMMGIDALFVARQAILMSVVAGLGLASAAAQEKGAAGPSESVTRADRVRAASPPPPDFHTKPMTTANAPAGGAQPQSSIDRGNPLWAISLASLTATRQRPIFSPSRRPPPRRDGGPNQMAASTAARPGRPPLVLVGAIAGESGGLAILLDETSKRIVRLKRGESHSGWTLRQVKGREATLQRDRDTAILALPGPSAK